MNNLFFSPLLITLLVGSSNQTNKIVKGEWMQLIDGKFVLSSSFNKRPTNLEYKFVDCVKNTCHYQYRTWFRREKRGIEEAQDYVVLKVTDKLFCNSMETSQVRYEQFTPFGGSENNFYRGPSLSSETWPSVKINPLRYRMTKDLNSINDGKFAFDICRQNKPVLLNEYIKKTFIEGNRIARLENLFKTSANLKYRYFANNICVKTQNKGIFNCITLKNKSKKDSLLVIDMNQKLMYVVGNSARKPICSKEEVGIKIYYGNPNQPDTNNFKPANFTAKFNSFIQNYLYILGCKKDLKPKWFFTGYFYPEYSYDEMPWEGNLVKTEKKEKDPIEAFYLRYFYRNANSNDV